MNWLKRILTACVALLLAVGAAPLYAAAETTIRVGDYLYLGVDENGSSILWRCVAMREDGPLMISNNVLTYKAFDANTAGVSTIPERPHVAEDIRASYGSNNWKESTLRQWLNTAGQVSWKGKTPDEGYVTANPYTDHRGFMSGFTKEELAAVKTVTNKTAINAADPADEGGAVHYFSLDWRLTSMLQNYDTAFAQYTQDSFFLLNTPEVIQLSNNLGNYYEVAYPTAYAATLCEEKYLDNVGATYYWLRDAYADAKFPEGVRCMYPGAHEYYYNAFNGNIGVRPAFVLAQTDFRYGSGTLGDPYTLDGTTPKEGREVVPAEKVEVDREYIGTAGVPEIKGTNASLAIGNYVLMGEMDGVPILWRCVDIDENGPLMLSDKLLRFYSFDATGEHENDPDGSRTKYGSNRWSTSSLRHWLNSDLDTWGNWEGVIVPSAENVYFGYSPYDKTPGFLTHFSQEEREMLKTVQISSVLNTVDIGEADSGSEVEDSLRKISLMLNITTTAYKENTTDTVFLMNREQANTVYELFDDYILAAPTDGAVTADSYQNFSVSPGKTWHYWLRDALGDPTYDYFVMDITVDGRVSADLAYSAQYGVRPAFYLDMTKLLLESGAGTAAEPYVVKAHDFGAEEILNPPTCERGGTAKRVCQGCGLSQTYALDERGHDHQVTVTAENLFFKEKTHKRCASCGMEYSTGGMAKPLLAVVLVVALAAVVFGVCLLIRTSKRKRHHEKTTGLIR